MNMRTRVSAALIYIFCLLYSGPATACELMGFSANESIPANNLFAAFRLRSLENPDGWGLAFYPDKSAVTFKEAANAAESELAQFLENYPLLRSRILIAHVRNASVGGTAHQNTHPFARELNGKEYTLVHNGTLRDFRSRLELGRIQPLGINDSEFLLCYLLGRMEKNGVLDWDEESFNWLREEMHIANDAGSLNCLFSDGTYLFAYHDKNGYNGLYCLSRKAPYGKVRFTDLAEEIDLSVTYPETAVSVLVATNPLTDEPWEKITPGQLLVFKDGVQLFPIAAPNKGNKPNKTDAGDGK